MMLRIVILLFTLFSCTIVYAQEPYNHTGVVNEQTLDAGQVTIDYQQYTLDNKTIVHSLMRRGESGPLFSAGQVLGFNVEQEPGKLPRITEVWLLGNNQ